MRKFQQESHTNQRRVALRGLGIAAVLASCGATIAIIARPDDGTITAGADKEEAGGLAGASLHPTARATVSSAVSQVSVSIPDGVSPELPISLLDYWASGPGATQAFVTQVESGIESCMSDQGLQYLPDANSWRLDQPKIVRELAAARTSSGYGIAAFYADESVRVGKSNPHKEFLNSLDERAYNEYVTALDGTGPADPASCRGQAIRNASPGLPIHNPEMVPVVGEAYLGVLNDERFAKAVEQWAVCMADTGLAFSGPDAARGSFESRAATASGASLTALGLEEARVAIADLNCELLYVTPVRHALEVEIVRALESSHVEYAGRLDFILVS